MIGVVLGLVVLAFAVVPWVVLATRTVPAAAAIALAVLLGFGLPLATLLVTTLIGAPVLTTVVVVGGAVGVLGVVLLARSRRSVRRASRPQVMMALPSLIGAIAWFVVLGIAEVRSSGELVAWAMKGDSANNILFAREVIYAGGISVGAGENPVPLASALMAIAMEFTRDGVPSSDLLRHDVTAFASLWAVLIALTCVLAGLLAVVIARACGAARIPAALSGGVASLLPLSWLVTGYPMQFGFFNAHIAFPIVIAGILVFLSWRAAPAAALALLMLTATLLLSVWSPLVLLPAALGLVVVVGGWRTILAVRGWQVVVLLASVIQLGAYGVASVLPSLLATGGALSAQGGAITFPPLMLPIAAGTAGVLALLATRSVRNPVVVATAALAIASCLGLAILLAVSRAEASPWTYYPSKFAWLAAVVLAFLLPGMVAPAVARVARRAWVVVAVALLAVGMLAIIPIATSLEDGQRRQHPVEWILASDGSAADDEVAEQILSLADLAKPRILWESGDPNAGIINFWLLQIAADSLDDNFQLRVYAYEAFRMEGVESLCDILGAMEPGVEIVTANPDLEGDVARSCGDRTATFVVR